jgi:hypothetical protein
MVIELSFCGSFFSCQYPSVDNTSGGASLFLLSFLLLYLLMPLPNATGERVFMGPLYIAII